MIFKRLLNRYYLSYRLFGSRSIKNYIEYLKKHGVSVGENVVFRYPKSTTIDLTRPELIEFGNNLDINANFTIMTHDFGTFVFRNLYGDFVPSSGIVKLGNNIYIGRDVTILKGVEIGDNCIIGLGSVVTKSMPANSVIAGVPARVICSIQDYYEHRKKTCINESIEYARILKQKKGYINICDLKEEWALFITKDDLVKYPEIESIIRLRLKDKFDFFINEQQRPFNGFDDFISKINY